MPFQAATTIIDTTVTGPNTTDLFSLTKGARKALVVEGTGSGSLVVKGALSPGAAPADFVDVATLAVTGGFQLLEFSSAVPYLAIAVPSGYTAASAIISEFDD
jgi:hypothetical protein